MYSTQTWNCVSCQVSTRRYSTNSRLATTKLRHAWAVTSETFFDSEWEKKFKDAVRNVGVHLGSSLLLHQHLSCCYKTELITEKLYFCQVSPHSGYYCPACVDSFQFLILQLTFAQHCWWEITCTFMSTFLTCSIFVPLQWNFMTLSIKDLCMCSPKRVCFC